MAHVVGDVVISAASSVRAHVRDVSSARRGELLPQQQLERRKQKLERDVSWLRQQITRLQDANVDAASLDNLSHYASSAASLIEMLTAPSERESHPKHPSVDVEHDLNEQQHTRGRKHKKENARRKERQRHLKGNPHEKEELRS